MSWGEVKKINSDLSVPLDELIKKETNYSEVVSKSVYNETSISITGAGECYLMMTDVYSTTVDGVKTTTPLVFLINSTNNVYRIPFSKSLNVTRGGSNSGYYVLFLK